MRRTAHLTRILIEGMSSYSPYRGSRIGYVRESERDPDPPIATDLVTKMDIQRAIKILYQRKELSKEELGMLSFVIADGRLSRRQISEIIEDDFGVTINQRTVSRRLNSAYLKIAKFLGFEYSDGRMFKMIAKRMGRPEPYILNDDEIDEILQIWERI